MKKAFTLSEVLTTLMVIGIIAAMTVPVLYNVTNAEKNRTFLKKTYAGYLINIQQTLASSGTICQSLACTRHWTRRVSGQDGNDQDIIDTTHNGALAQASNFNYENCDDCIDKNSDLPAPLKGNDFSTYRLPNRAYVAIYDYEGNCRENINNHFKACSVMVIDVNGEKGPNTPCKDRYAFYLANEPYSNSQTIDGVNYDLIQSFLVPFGYNDAPNFATADYNCTAEMIYNNWKITR